MLGVQISGAVGVRRRLSGPIGVASSRGCWFVLEGVHWQWRGLFGLSMVAGCVLLMIAWLFCRFSVWFIDDCMAILRVFCLCRTRWWLSVFFFWEVLVIAWVR